MHFVDIVAVCVAGLLLLVLAAVLARQRFMLRAPGSIPMALRRRRPGRWQYGMARFVADELRWFGSLGVGTRPSRVLRRGELTVHGRHAPAEGERSVLPPDAVIVECRDASGELALALGEGAYPGFVSWLESAPSS